MTAALPLPCPIERAGGDVFVRMMADLRFAAQVHGVHPVDLVLDLHERLEELLAQLHPDAAIQLAYARHIARRDDDLGMLRIARDARARLAAAGEAATLTPEDRT